MSAAKAPIDPLPLGGFVYGLDFSHGRHGTIEIQADEPFTSALGKNARVLLVPDEMVYRAAPDHALLLAAITAGRVKWFAKTSRLAFLDPRYVMEIERAFTLEVDDFGCPVLTDEARAAIHAGVSE